MGAAGKSSNSLLFLLAHYTGKRRHYSIVFQVLNNYLAPHSPEAVTIEQKAYRILCHELANSPIAEKVSKELMALVQQFRTTKDHSELHSLEYQLGVVKLLGIY